MIVIASYTDAAIGKSGGGVGVVIRGYVEGNKNDSFVHEVYAPMPICVGQTDAELFGMLTGIQQVDCTIANHGLKPVDFYLKVFTDSEAAIWAIHNGPDIAYVKSRILVKRIIRTMGKYHQPMGGGAGFVTLTRKGQKNWPNTRDVACMMRAHQLSRMARTLATDLLKR